MSTSKNFATCHDIQNHLRYLFEEEERDNKSNASLIAEVNNDVDSSSNELSGGADDNIVSDNEYNEYDGDVESDENEEEAQNFFDGIPNDEDKRTTDPFQEGTKVFSDQNLDIVVKSVAHKKRNRYEINDHLYRVTFHRKTSQKTKLINIEWPLQASLIKIINELKKVYKKDNQHQIYVTVIEKRIKSGLNSGNYSLNTPSAVIARWVLSMLYNYLKSKQTMTLNKSFNVMIKVLSVKHIRDLVKNKNRKKMFRPHMYH